MNLSISIVNWNTKNHLKRCLDSIYENNYKDFEVFVVDNNSNDGSSEMVKNNFPKVNLITNAKNIGFAKANNQAIKLSHEKYILILNPDIFLFKNTISKMIDFMEENPPAGAIGIKLLDENGSELKKGYFRKYPSIPQLIFFYTIFENISLKNRWLRNRYWELVDTSRIMEIQQIPGACLLLRRKVIEEIGAFDERFHLFFEDVDLCYRIKKSGWKIFFVPETEAIHIGAQSIGMLTYTELASTFFNSMYLYFKKNHSLIKALTAKLIITINALFKIIILRCLYYLSDYKRLKRLEHIHMLYKFIKALWIR